MTGRERMLAVYRGKRPDAVPVSPELWDAAALDLSDRPFHRVVGPFAERPFWEVLLEVHRRYASDAWVVLGAGAPRHPARPAVERHRFLDEATIETERTWRCPGRELRAVSRTTASYAGWRTENPVKDFERDLPLWQDCFFDDPDDLDLAEVDEAVAETAEDGIVTVAVGELFTSFLASSLEGGMTRALAELADRDERLRPLADRYAEHLAALAETVLAQTAAQAVFLNSGSTLVPVVSPDLWRRWDLPVVRAVCVAAHRCGGSVHLHNHGRLRALLPDLVAAGVDVLCGLFSPPVGDVDDLGALVAECRRLSAAAHRRPMALKGMVDPFGVLCRGSPAEVEAEVRNQIAAAGADGAFILGTQDGTLPGTPQDNLRAFVRAGRAYGRLP